MRDTRNEPVLTDTYATAAAFQPDAGSLYFFGTSDEARSRHVAGWRGNCPGVLFVEVESESQSEFSVHGDTERYLLRSQVTLDRLFVRASTSARVYIDITGLTHPVWAAILRTALSARLEVLVVYVEPDEYIRSSAPVEGQIYDLSSAISGIAPLPGFARLLPGKANDFIFVPLLGFEGTRLRYLIEQVQPGYERIFPIIGSPGFKPWYVFETYAGNKGPLSETSAWQAIRYAPANCPFSCFYLLTDIAESAPSTGLKIAPIGTKPHALAAVLFALTTAAPTELVYDHPVRKPGRTGGTARLLVYHVSSIASGLGARSLAKRVIGHGAARHRG